MTAPFIRKESSPFLKRVLIPFWVLRLLVLVVGIGSYGFTLAIIIAYTDDLQDYERQYNTKLPITAAKAALGVVLALLLICAALEITCIVKRGRRTLSPKFFLIVNVLQTVFVVVMFILAMIGMPGAGGVAVAVVILLFFLGFLTYSSVIFHKFRKGRL
ncbi:hypothetical protein QBC39DRAFT_234326, partial [Podospora conica]